VKDGYYWARHYDGTAFIIHRDEGQWWISGCRTPVTNFNTDLIIQPVQPLMRN